MAPIAQSSLKRKAIGTEESKGRKKRMADNSGLGIGREKYAVTHTQLGSNEVESDDDELGVESINANAILAEMGMCFFLRTGCQSSSGTETACSKQRRPKLNESAWKRSESLKRGDA
jgi:hypothetical protein